MINQRYCPICKSPAKQNCVHLALAVEGRLFVERCIEACQGLREWQALCQSRRNRQRALGEWSPEQEDFTWLETAFCDQFLRPLSWFGGMDYEWRSGDHPEQGGFCVLLWSKDPQRLWWQLHDEFERQGQNDMVKWVK